MGRETWYVLEDGSVADPNECSHGENGRLVHKSGAPVAMRGEFPHSTGVDVPEDGEPAKGRSRQIKAKKGDVEYETR